MTTSIADAEHAPVVHLLTRETGLAERLEAALIGRGPRFVSAATLDGLGLDGERPASGLLVVDTDTLDDPAALAGLQRRVEGLASGALKLVCLSDADDIRARVAALHAGARLHLETGQAAEALAERLLDLLGADLVMPDRVLVVDDQPVAALFAARVLETAGMRVERVGDPFAVMGALADFIPDLVLMDLHMPGVSGIELTRILREQERFAELPIIFLSAELDPSQQLAALRVGGDDFLAKPVAPDQLVTCVRERLARARERARQQRAREQRDPLTGLPGRERLLSRLDRLVAQRRLDGDRRALVVIEIPGDAPALGSLGARLVTRITEPDLAVRLGEQRLAILLRRETPEALERDCEGLAATLDLGSPGAGEAVSAPPAQFGVGIGWCSLAEGGEDAATLLSRAAKAARDASIGGETGPLRYRRGAPATHDPRAADPLVAALRAERLRLLFEPMVTLTHAPRARYEVSPRLATDDGELLAPSDFVPIARDSGLTEALDTWLLSASLDSLAECLRAGRPTQLFVHQSWHSVVRAEWLERVREAIDRRGLFRMRPVLQLQLQELQGDPEGAAERVESLAQLGIPVCINGLCEETDARGVLDRVSGAFARLSRGRVQGGAPVALAEQIQGLKARGIQVIAAGVETPETIAQLCRAGADLLQGPFVQPPSARMDYDFGARDTITT